MRGAIIIILSCFFLVSNAQQEPIYSHYLFDPLILNPAYSGARDQGSVTMLGRRQWLGVDRAPTSYYIGGHMPSPDLEHGFGFTLLRDAVGFTDMTNLNISYAYRIHAGKHHLALGLLGGVHHFHSNLLIVKTKVLGDPAFFFNQVNRWLPNAGAGVYYNTDKLFAGFAVPNILPGRLNPVDRQDLQARRYMYMNFNGGGIVDLQNGAKFRPSMMIRYAPGIPVSMDLTGSFFLRDMLWVGASWRYREAFVFFAELQYRQWRVGYSYDFIQSDISAFTTGSHEIMLSFDIGFTKDNKRSPRYF